MSFVAVNTHVHTPRKITQSLSSVIDDKIRPQVTLGLFPPHPWPLRQQVVLPVPTTLLPQRPSIECFLWPSTHLVGLATMPHNLGLTQWVRQYSGKFLSLHPPAKANSWPFGWEKGGSLGPVPASWETLCGASVPQGWNKMFRVINVESAAWRYMLSIGQVKPF